MPTKEQYWANPQKYRDKQKISGAKRSDKIKEYKRKNADRIRERERQYASSLKIETFSQYGTICQCCGESNMAFLVLDHINGNGNNERRRLFGTRHAGGKAMWRYLKKHGYPPGYQVLCHNCNWTKSNGGCPHRAGRSNI